MADAHFDAIIIGGGPAGLAAALWLGRYRRRVVVLDTGEPRNDPAWGVHGYPGLVDPTPTELRRLIHDQAINAGAEYDACRAVSVQGEKNAFVVHAEDGRRFHARRLLLAYGLRDHLPDIDGAAELYGSSLFHCPDCDGPTVQDRDVAVIGGDRHAATLALYLLSWTDRVSLLAHDRPVTLDTTARATLAAAGVPLFEARVARLECADGRLAGVELDDGTKRPCVAIFFHIGSEPRCAIGETLGCDCDADGYIVADRGQETSIPGLYAAGDITGHPHLASVAVAEGVRAALTMHRSLLPVAWSLA